MTAKIDRLGLAWLAAFAASIVLANYLISTEGTFSLSNGEGVSIPLAFPAGVVFAALVFTFRDGVRERLGYRGALAAIALGAVLSFYLEAVTSTSANILRAAPDLLATPDALWRVFTDSSVSQFDYFLNSYTSEFEPWTLAWGLLPVSLASALAFGLSELLDAQVYERIRQVSRIVALTVSNTAGLILDSALFAVLAFGLEGNFEAGHSLAAIIAGLVVAKWVMTCVAVTCYALYRDCRPRVAESVRTT